MAKLLGAIVQEAGAKDQNVAGLVITEDTKATTATKPGEKDEDSDEEDDDFDPNAKVEEVESDSDKDEVIPDYKGIEATTTQVRTRKQRYFDDLAEKTKDLGLVKVDTTVDIDLIFEELKAGKTKDDWVTELENAPTPEEAVPETKTSIEDELITIKSSYTFAGKVFTETKQVDINSAEAKAYLNSTMSLTEEEDPKKRSFIPILRKLPGTDEDVELRIKLKRPSLIDKFLNGNKKQKLSTLEKSRLDWAGFVDKRKIKDELKIYNKAGYLDKQDFLGRLQAKRDDNYQLAKEKLR